MSTITEQIAGISLASDGQRGAGGAEHDAGLPVPDDKTAVSMFTAHQADDTLRRLAQASERMTAARRAPSPELRQHHCGHLSGHLEGALKAAHGLRDNIRAHYPAEAAELDAVGDAVGLAKAVSGNAKAATTAHLLETTLHELAHAVRHGQQMLRDTPDGEWDFNADHAEKHLGGAAEHAGKLAQHFKDNYPDVAKWLNGLGEVTPPAGEGDGKQDGEPQHARYGKDGGKTITAQLANRGYELNPRSGMISLDLPEGIITPVPGGVSDFHITVVYLGKDVDDEAFAQACKRAQAAAAQVPGPLTGMVGGIGTFPSSGGSEGKVPAWAGVILPGAECLRSALEDLSASEHKDWKQHVTLAYVDPGDPLPPPVPSMQVSISHLSVHRGDDEVARYPIGGEPGRPGGTITAQMANGETIGGQAL